jgi:hypothetical protein
MALMRSPAARRSVVDVGCLWSVDGACAFAAEEGATAVTGVDLMPGSIRFETGRSRRRSKVRLVHGDVHDPAVVAYAPAAGAGRAIGVTEPFDPAEDCGNWWWRRITPSALRGMLRAASFVLDELRLEPFVAPAVARPR